MAKYSRNTMISELKVQSFQGLELLCPTASCRQKVRLPLENFSDDLTLDIIHWTTACSICGRPDVYATPIMTFFGSKNLSVIPTEDRSLDQSITQLAHSRIVELCQKYPDYVRSRALQIAKADFAKNPNQNWNSLSRSEQLSIVEDQEVRIREGHFKQAALLTFNALFGLPVVI